MGVTKTKPEDDFMARKGATEVQPDEQIPQAPDKDGEEAEPTGYLKELPLENGIVVEYKERGIRYTVVQKLGSGSFGITYLVRNPENEILVLKEFCLTGARRTEQHGLDFTDVNYDAATLDTMIRKFRNEPERVMRLFEVGKGRAMGVTDKMSYSEAFNAARQEVKAGGVFTWHGETFSTYERDEKEKLNLVLPRTKCFECFGNLYYVMERAEGQSVKDYIMGLHKEDARDLNLYLKIMEQLAIAVHNIHQIPCVHQDITPANVIFNRLDNGDVKLKVIDFGLAADMNKIREDIIRKAEGNGTLTIGGTTGFTDVFYNSDNYYNRTVNNLNLINLVDIYSLGCILYYMLFFRFNNQWGAQMQEALQFDIQKIQEGKIKEPFTLDEDDSKAERVYKQKMNAVFQLVKNATSKRLSERYQSAYEFLKHLRAIMTNVKWDKEEDHIVGQSTGELYLNFEHSHDWKAKILPKNNGWLVFDKEKYVTSGGGHGNTSVRLVVKENTDPLPREATVCIECGVLSLTKNITQKGVEVKDVPDSIIFPKGTIPKTDCPFSGCEGKIIFSSSKSWEAKVPAGGVKWISLGRQAGEEGLNTVYFTVKPNADSVSREADILFSCGKAQIIWKVIQAMKPADEIHLDVIRFKPDSLRQASVVAGAATLSFGFEADVPGEVKCTAEWLHVQADTFVPGSHDVPVTVDANDTDEDRSATVDAWCGDQYISFTVKQEHAVKEVLKPRVVNMQVDFEGGASARTISFKAKKAWTICMDPETVDWVMLDRNSGEAGEIRIKVSVAPNKSGETRSMLLVLMAGKKEHVYKVVQKPKKSFFRNLIGG